MKNVFSFTCECTLERNGVEISMKNSKAKNKTIKIVPFTDTTQETPETIHYVSIYIGNSEECLYKTRVEGITRIQNRFINEGKLTLEIAEEVNPLSQKVHVNSDVNLREIIRPQKFLLVMIKNALPDVLKTFCTEILEKKKKKAESVPTSEKKTTVNGKIDSRLSSSQKTPTSSNTLVRTNTPNSSRLENNAFKVNRNSAIPAQNQQSGVLKRNFDALNKSKSLEMEKVQVTKKFKWTIQNPFETLPELVLIKITEFLHPKEVSEMKLLNRYFAKVLYNAKLVVDFRKKGDVPPGIIVKLLNICKNLEKIYLGPSKFLQPKQFLDEINIEFRKLKFIDFSPYHPMNDKILLKFFYNIKTLETIKIGYFSGVTDSAIDMLPNVLDNVKGLYLKSANKTHVMKKDKLTDTCLAKFLKKYTKLEHFSVYIAGTLFLHKTLDEPLLNLKTIKFDVITLGERADIISLENLANLENLEFLKIGKIVIDKFETQLSGSESELFKEIFVKMPKLKAIKFGNFTNNYVMLHISRHCPNLEKLVIFSDNVDDEGMSHVLEAAEKLLHLDIHKCKSVNGHCLEGMTTYILQKLVVEFDDFKMKVIRNIFQSKGMTNTVIENREPKKR